MANIGDAIVSAGGFIRDKAKDVSGYAKLSIDLRSKESYIDAKYKELGREYYEAHKDDDMPDFDVVLLINEAKQEIEEIKEQLIAMKGVSVCKACGHEIKDDDVFCSKCGMKIERDLEEPDFFSDDGDLLE